MSFVRKMGRPFIVALTALMLVIGGISAPANAAPAKIPSGTNLSFTDSRGLQSRYHVYSNGVNWNKDVGVLYYFDGDYFSAAPQYSQIMRPNGATLKSMARNANSKNLVLIAVKTPSNRTSANGWTWWENGTRNAQWFQEFATAMKKKGKLNPKHTWLAGYSGGAEFITFDIMTRNRSAWMTGGGAVIIAGGGAGAKTKPSTAHRAMPMTWYVGSRDTAGQTNPPTWSALNAARKGQALYKRSGYTKATLKTLPGVGHKGYNLANLINQTTKAVSQSSSADGKVVNFLAKTNRATTMKSSRGTNAKVVKNLGPNYTVRVERENSSWYRIKAGGKTGWVPKAHFDVQ